MFLEEYISFVYKGKAVDNAFQYQTQHSQDFYQNNKQALETELLQHFLFWMYSSEVKKSVKFNFLDYHLRNYVGDPIDFLEFVRRSPNEPINPDADFYTFLAIREYDRVYNNYIEPKKEWLELRKVSSYSNHKAIGSSDDRIQGYLSEDQVKEYFFSKFRPAKGEPILSEEDVWHFLRANFAGFTPRVEPKLLDAKATQIAITRIIRKFYLEHSKKSTEAQVYCKMMMRNFSTHRSMTFKSLSSSFSTCLN